MEIKEFYQKVISEIVSDEWYLSQGENGYISFKLNVVTDGKNIYIARAGDYNNPNTVHKISFSLSPRRN
jgi:hypothetical protein